MGDNPMIQSTIQAVNWWKDETEAWFNKEVHGRETPEVIGIGGQVVIDFSDEWTEDDIRHVRDCLLDHDFDVKKCQPRSGKIRIAPSTKPCVPLQ